jgi:outer membrane protein TolC
MKNFTAVVLSLSLFIGAYSQETAKYNTMSYNSNVDSVAEKLVAMALNNASVRGAENLSEQFKYIYKASKTSWLNNIVLQGNLNEYSFNQNNPNDPLRQATQYPKYNFGVLLPIGLFFNNPKQVKADYYKYQYSLDQVSVEKQNIRREVLINYHDYTTDKELLAQHQQLVNDWRIIHLKNEQKFSKGEITLEAFYNSTKTYTDELSKQSNLTDALKTTAAKLEALIGMNVDDALTQINATSK